MSSSQHTCTGKKYSCSQGLTSPVATLQPKCLAHTPGPWWGENPQDPLEQATPSPPPV